MAEIRKAPTGKCRTFDVCKHCHTPDPPGTSPYIPFNDALMRSVRGHRGKRPLNTIHHCLTGACNMCLIT